MTAAALALIEYPTTEDKIAEAGKNYAALEAGTPKGYKAVVEAIAVLRGTRGEIEKRRVELKADALEFGRKVDAAAKKLTLLVSNIEERLKAKKQVVDDEEARLKREAEKAELVALEAKLKAEREKEEARLKAQREAQAAEQARIDAERKVVEDQKRAVAAQQAEVERREAAARPVVPEPAPAVVVPFAGPPPRPLRSVPPASGPEPIADQVNRVHAFAREIAELADRAPAFESSQAGAAITWTVERLHRLGADLMRFQPKDIG